MLSQHRLNARPSVYNELSNSLINVFFFNYFLISHLRWRILVVHHPSQVPTTFQPPFCGQRNRKFITVFNEFLSCQAYALVFSPNRLIVDEATADDNSGKAAGYGLVYAAEHDSSCYPQPSNNGAAFSFPW